MVGPNFGIRRIVKIINYFRLSIPHKFTYLKCISYTWFTLGLKLEIYSKYTFLYFRGPNMKDTWRGYKISNNRFYRVLKLIHEYLNK